MSWTSHQTSLQQGAFAIGILVIHLFDESHQTSHCPKADLTTESPSKGVLSLINPEYLVLVL